MQSVAELIQSVTVLNSMTGQCYSTVKFSGQGTRLIRTDNKGEYNISPILPRGELIRWIDAFAKGYETAKLNRA